MNQSSRHCHVCCTLLHSLTLSIIDRLFLNDNTIAGAIPSSFGKLTKLGRLVLTRNLVGGSLPTELANMSELSKWKCVVLLNSLYVLLDILLTNHYFLLLLSIAETFGLGRNVISGAIPSEIGNMNKLRKFSFRHTHQNPSCLERFRC